MIWRSQTFWAAVLGLWTLALFLPRPDGHPPGKNAGRWPPRNFVVYYGPWNSASIDRAHAYDLIVAHPGKQLARFNSDLVGRLRSGKDGLPGNSDDSLVLAYLSLGEDEDAPIGPVARARRYLDRKTFVWQDGFPRMGEDGMPLQVDGSDGIPDRNGAWGSYYVHPMDPEWRKLLEVRLDQLAQRGVDGFFLDTVDVVPELQEEMFQLIVLLHARYPQLRWVSNRGVTLLEAHPDLQKCLDGVVLESWFTHWNWSWGRAVVAPDRAENERLSLKVLQPAGDLCKLYLDYLDPKQPDRGSLLALRRGHQPAFWSHPFLDRMETVPEGPATPLPVPSPRPAERLEDGRISADSWGEAWALGPRGEFLLPGPPPWAVGDARQLRLRRVDEKGNVSPAVVLEIPPGNDDWITPWNVLELEDRLQVRWEGGEEGEVWLGESPEGLRPTSISGKSPLVAGGLKLDRLVWVSISHPGGAPDRARPARTHDVTPPPPPTRVQARRHGAYLTVTWDQGALEEVAGYRIYVSLANGPLCLPYTRNRDERNLQVKVPAEPLRVLVTCFDKGNHESRPGTGVDL